MGSAVVLHVCTYLTHRNLCMFACPVCTVCVAGSVGSCGERGGVRVVSRGNVCADVLGVVCIYVCTYLVGVGHCPFCRSLESQEDATEQTLERRWLDLLETTVSAQGQCSVSTCVCVKYDYTACAYVSCIVCCVCACVCVGVCMRAACVRACVCVGVWVCVRACVRACVCVHGACCAWCCQTLCACVCLCS